MSTRGHVRAGGGGLSWFALILGVAIGIGAGLFYTWEIDPIIEHNTAPWQLGKAAREDYVVAVALSYAHNRDLTLAFNRLLALKPEQNVWQLVADVACERVKTGKTVSNSDIRVIRALEQLYRPQGASGCADGLYPTPAPLVFVTPIPSPTVTPTLPPPPTKTPTPSSVAIASPPVLPTPTPAVGERFIVTRTQSFCDPNVDGVIEVRVYDEAGEGIPGVPVTVLWSGSETERFYTGLQPERGLEYADFQMTPGRTYTVTIPGLVSAPPQVEAAPCRAELDGEMVTVTTSYWVNFQQRAR